MPRSRVPSYRGSIICLVMSLVTLVLVLKLPARAQDGNTSLQGIVEDLSGARIAHADVALLDPDNGFHSAVSTDGEGRFSFAMLAPGRYTVAASAPGMAVATQAGLELHVGGSLQLQLRLRPAGRTEHITVTAPPALIDPDSGEVSQVIDQQAIADLPLNGRRFTDLALLSPGVTQDPRGLTSGSNGDLSYGGTRGYQNSFLVDGTDNNNSFFAQARGRYRAPYQFSNEVIKEFRVSSNGYSAELGRAGERSSMWSPTRAATTGTAAPFSMCATATSMPSRPTSAANLMSSSGNSVGLSGGAAAQESRVFVSRIRSAPVDGAVDHAIRQWSQQCSSASGRLRPQGQGPGLRRRCTTERHGGRVLDADGRQCRIRQAGSEPLLAAPSLFPAQPLALLRQQQRVLRSSQPHHDVRRNE